MSIRVSGKFKYRSRHSKLSTRTRVTHPSYEALSERYGKFELVCLSNRRKVDFKFNRN